MKNPKYLLFVIDIFLVVVIAKLADISSILAFVFVIMGVDATILVVLAFQEKLPKLKETRSAQFSKYDSPTNWLRVCIFAFMFSLITGGVYSVFYISDIEMSNIPIIGNWALLFYTIASFFFGFIYVGRIAYFRHQPASKGNIIVGKLILGFLDIAIRVIYCFFVVALQLVNITLFYIIITGAILQNAFPKPIGIIYASVVVVGMAGMAYIIYKIAFHLREKFNRSVWVSFIAYFSPWIVFFITVILVAIGIKL